jgi:hypothetical protein
MFLTFSSSWVVVGACSLVNLNPTSIGIVARIMFSKWMHVKISLNVVGLMQNHCVVVSTFNNLNCKIVLNRLQSYQIQKASLSSKCHKVFTH